MKIHNIKAKPQSIGVWVTVGSNDLSAWAFIEAPHAMWRPDLYKEDKQKEFKPEVRLTQEQNKRLTTTIWRINRTSLLVCWVLYFDNLKKKMLNLIADLVILSAVVAKPPVECRRPIRWTEGWLTCFQGHGCYDGQWHDNTAEWKARQYVI